MWPISSRHARPPTPPNRPRSVSPRSHSTDSSAPKRVLGASLSPCPIEERGVWFCRLGIAQLLEFDRHFGDHKKSDLCISRGVSVFFLLAALNCFEWKGRCSASTTYNGQGLRISVSSSYFARPPVTTTVFR